MIYEKIFYNHGFIESFRRTWHCTCCDIMLLDDKACFNRYMIDTVSLYMYVFKNWKKTPHLYMYVRFAQPNISYLNKEQTLFVGSDKVNQIYCT